VTVVENNDAGAEMANGVNAFKLTAGVLTICGIHVHAGSGPP
jgi:hypothetical protein